MKLNLDWTLDSSEKRVAFINTLLESEPSLSSANLNSIAEYLLWPSQGEEFYIESQNSPWSKKEQRSKREVSLDALYEESELTGRPVDTLINKTNYKKTNPKLSRDEVLSHLNLDKETFYLKNPGSLAESWLLLWLDIDYTEFLIQNWELHNGKRRPDLPIRPELIDRITWRARHFKEEPEIHIKKLIEESHELKPKNVLFLKRHLVTQRQQQYQYLDMIRGEPMKTRASVSYHVSFYLEIEDIYPFSSLPLLIGNIAEEHFTNSFQTNLTNALRHSDNIKNKSFIFDFTNADHIRSLLLYHGELETQVAQDNIGNEVIARLLRYLDYYTEKAQLTPDLELIKELKNEGVKNREISKIVNERYQINYKELYISTIYTKRIIGAIIREVERHYKLMEYLTMGKNVFKTCSRCKRLLPRNREYFNQRSSTGDGFLSYCKDCRQNKGV